MTDRFLNPSEAARRLRVSAKALRLYEQRGLIRPPRTAGGWRAYGPTEMASAGEIAALRALGFSLTQVERVLAGAAQDLEPTLAAHQARLETQLGRLAAVVRQVARLRADLAQGKTPSVGELAALAGPPTEPLVAFDLPWPWGGERFELTDVRAVNYITGPLGSGKTRLALALAEHLPGAAFIDLDRAADGAAQARTRLAADPALKARVDAALAWLEEDGAAASDALAALLAELESDRPFLVVDLIEHDLDEPTQLALGAWLRRRAPEGQRLFAMTRSSAILDLDAVGEDATILLCPANHSPPMQVAPRPGAPGYEAVATCLACPQVRARTQGMAATLSRSA